MVKKIESESPPAANELRLRHLTQDEALPLLERFLHDSFVAGFYQVKVVHGKGTGTIRNLVWRYLATHPLVKSYRAGIPGEGSAGVTIVELSEK
ncbi:MAG: Smr/MutS family protein [Dehalococcoidales bacterium]|nr:Smr/MutS family protein [Dehalococcoidales bacterium]